MNYIEQFAYTEVDDDRSTKCLYQQMTQLLRLREQVRQAEAKQGKVFPAMGDNFEAEVKSRR